jgi:hypothetical protein
VIAASLQGQPVEENPGIGVTSLSTLREKCLLTGLVQVAIESPPCMHIGMAKRYQSVQVSSFGKQVHVPQVRVVTLVVGAVAIGVGLHRRYGQIPVPALLRVLRNGDPVVHHQILRLSGSARRGSRKPDAVSGGWTASPGQTRK